MSSNLKYLSIEELKEQKRRCQNRIRSLGSQLSGQKVRLEWIEKYLFEKTPQEMSIEEIENKLGHAVILKECSPYDQD